MTVSGISDLQMSLIGRRQNANLRAELIRLTQEISTGQTSNVQKAVSGDTAPLAAIDRDLGLLDGFDFSAARAELKLSYMSTSLEKVQSNTSALGAKVLTALEAGSNTLEPVLDAASSNFDSAVSALQAQAGNRFVFSGLNSGESPLISGNEMLTLLRAQISGITDPAIFLDEVDRWFTEAGNGFETVAYQGGPQSTVDLMVSSTVVIDDMFTADDDVIRATLRDLAIVTLVSEGSFAGTDEQRASIMQTVGSNLVSVDDQLTETRASIGQKQQAVAEAIIQNQSERYSLNQARNEIIGIDVFEAAGRLEEVQTQLESLYLITARTSRLNLTEYLR